MKTGIYAMAAVLAVAVGYAKEACQCECKCPTNEPAPAPTPAPTPDPNSLGSKLKTFLSCYAPWIGDIDLDGNSNLHGCDEATVVHCRTNNEFDLFCQFDGTNNLVPTQDRPDCWYSCGMMSCDAWIVPLTDDQKHCIAELYTPPKRFRS